MLPQPMMPIPTLRTTLPHPPRARPPRRRPRPRRPFHGESGGDDRNRTGVDGFAIRCVTTPPRRPAATPSSNAAAHRQGGKPRRWPRCPGGGNMPSLGRPDPSRDSRMIDYAAAREAMVDRQVRPSDVTRYPIIAAMLEVPREDFVPEALRPVAYLGEHVPLAPGRVLLDPRVFAKLLDALDVGPKRPGARPRLRPRLLDRGAGADGRGGGRARGRPGDGGRGRGAARRARASTTRSFRPGRSPRACRSTGRSTRSWSRARSRCCPQALADAAQARRTDRRDLRRRRRRPGAARAPDREGIAWRRIFDATAPVLPGFAATKAFEF